MLCDQFQVGTDYLENRIKTVFLDGKPVDDEDKAIVKNGSTLVLSAAMPGLVGSTFRKSGVLVSFRSGITYQEEDAVSDRNGEITATIKLFNMVARELGPTFLYEGIYINKDDLRNLLHDISGILPSFVQYMEKDEEEIQYEQLNNLNWFEESENVFFRVLVQSDNI